jgi:hypothetical protein
LGELSIDEINQKRENSVDKEGVRGINLDLRADLLVQIGIQYS